jgi:hypothetical protein
MAKGEGGGGHFDERRRAARKPTTEFADDPAILEAIVKPRAKPVVVKKKPKPKMMPMAPPRKLEQVVNRGAKQDKFYGDIVSREAKASRQPGPFDLPNIVMRKGKGNLGGETVNRYANSKGDRLGIGSLFGMPDYNPFPTGRLTSLADARDEAAAGENEGYGVMKRNQRY